MRRKRLLCSSARHRPLYVEQLESRRLLAANCFPFDTTEVAQVSTARLAQSSLSEQSVRSSGYTIESNKGVQEFYGSLSWFDRSDTFNFQVERDANVSIDLSGMRTDVDLYLTDNSGNLIARSTLGGRQSDSIDIDLVAGSYHIYVVAVGFWSTRYKLALSTTLVSHPPNSNDADALESSDQVAPLSDVSYFGGRHDWGLNSVGAPEAWAAGYTGDGVTVAVIDTGVDLDHPDLVSNLFVNPGEIAGNGIDDDGNGFIDDINGYDFAARDAIPNDTLGHGTHVAGIIAASNNGVGPTGVAHGAKILPVRVLGKDGVGSSIDVAAGIRYAADLGADIINLSLGGGYSRAIDSAVAYAESLGSLIVAAAGNESWNLPSYPARFSATDSNVISVGAHDASNRLAGFSNLVGRSNAVQVDAPGVNVFSTYVGGGYATLSGTSMAAPHIAALAAITLSANPSLTSTELRNLLTHGVTDQATRSDSIGQANTKLTVAYAAAGMTSINQRSSSSSVPPSDDPSVLARRYRYTTVTLVPVSISAPTSSRPINSIENDEIALSSSTELLRKNHESAGVMDVESQKTPPHLVDMLFAESDAERNDATENDLMLDLSGSLMLYNRLASY